MAYSTATIGNITISILTITDSKQPTTQKQKVGYTLIQHKVPETTTQDWILNITGEFIGLSKDTNRTNLAGYDDLSVFAYADGMHNGNYVIVPGTLTFNDSSAYGGNKYMFSVQLLQYNQVI